MYGTPIVPMPNCESPGAGKAQSAEIDSLAASTLGLKYASRGEA